VKGVANVVQKQDHTTIQDGFNALPGDGGVVEVRDSGRYAEDLDLTSQKRRRLELRAANKHRPVLVLSRKLTIVGTAEQELTLNGFLIVGAGLEVQSVGRLRLRHCTLVPGLALNADGSPAQPMQPSLAVTTAGVALEIDHCIVGGLRVHRDSPATISNSIVDATDPAGMAYSVPDGQAGLGGALRVAQSTLVGQVHADALPLASNSIFFSSDMTVFRRQEGCVRFCSLPAAARVPRRYHCQPADGNDVQPLFTSLRYGDAGYAQLSDRCPPEIRRGGDDEAEMGVFHDLFQPQREDDLRARLEEYLRFGLEAGLFHAT
jgi:hypothetical protein